MKPWCFTCISSRCAAVSWHVHRPSCNEAFRTRGVCSQAEGKHQEALNAITGDLGQAIQMEEERIVLQYELMVRLYSPCPGNQ